MENRLITIGGRRYLAIPIPEKKLTKEPEEDLEVEGRIRRDPFKFKRSDVITSIKKQRAQFKDYKTIYLSWNNERFALKSLFQFITSIPRYKYNTVQLIKYFEALGFEVNRMR